MSFGFAGRARRRLSSRPRSLALPFPLPRSLALPFPLPRSLALLFPLPRSLALLFPLPRSLALPFPLPRSLALPFPLPRSLALLFPLALLSLGAAPGNATAGALMSTDHVPDAIPAIDPAALASARALGEANVALEQGDLQAAAAALARARADGPLADYVALFDARLLLAVGKPNEAAEAARQGDSTHAGSPVAGAFATLLGEALLATGDEPGARAAWKTAMDRPGATREREAALRGAILDSHTRTGTLEAAIAAGDVPGIPIHPDPQLSESRQTALRSPTANILHADGLVARGRSAAAIDAYDAALAATTLTVEQRAHAELQRGHAQFSLRRYPEAIASFGALLPQPEARFWHARAIARNGESDAAIRLFEAIGDGGDPEYGSFALYLSGTLLEGRERERAMALFGRVAELEGKSARARDALWRLGWSAYRHAEFAKSRVYFRELAARSEGLDVLRPDYWGARAAELAGDSAAAKSEFARLARSYPLSYYGWRASERLTPAPAKSGLAGNDAEPEQQLARGSSAIDATRKLRVALLLEAGLSKFAESELGGFADEARGLDDRKAVASLYARAGDYHAAQRLVVDAYAEPLSRGVQRGDEALWWLSWPPAFKELVLEEFPKDAVIEPALVWAIMREESSYRPYVTSSAGARGLLQIMPETGAHLASTTGLASFEPDDLFTPRINIQLGSAYLDRLGRRFPDRLSATICSYNAGPTAVDTWLRGDQATREDDAWVEDIPYEQTRSYVKRVLRSLHVYRTFYDVPAPGA